MDYNLLIFIFLIDAEVSRGVRHFCQSHSCSSEDILYFLEYFLPDHIFRLNHRLALKHFGKKRLLDVYQGSFDSCNNTRISCLGFQKSEVHVIIFE